jgi:signal transduction histidine kinase
LYDRVGAAALSAFLVPVVVARQTLLRSQMYFDTRAAYASRESALRSLMNQIQQERADERRLIAADLHDEVLQPLFKVTLMAQVLKTELATGRLLEMDQDLPELLSAAEAANESIRSLVGELRLSTLGGGGLMSALTRLVEDWQRQTATPIELSLSGINLEAPQDLAMYQIAKEALANAITHAGATSIRITALKEGKAMVLCVEDDGRGFDASRDTIGHYGIPIMRERAMIASGTLYVDSVPGKGTRVVLSMPTQTNDAAP